MTDTTEPLGKLLTEAGTPRPEVSVRVSREIVTLLSEQLYSSPLKAVEELVVNSFDADAMECSLSVPMMTAGEVNVPVVVFDDGVGMDERGLADLWHVGHSSKREESVQLQRTRQQIGKFGIGKLATYAIAQRITYVTKTTNGPILATTLDYQAFREDPTGGGGDAVQLAVTELTQERVSNDTRLRDAMSQTGVELAHHLKTAGHFTVVLLEGFKPKVKELRQGRLRWVLSTAMPLRADFRVYLNGEEIQSSKEDFKRIVAFTVADLPNERVKRISEQTEQTWQIADGKLTSPAFPAGLSLGPPTARVGSVRT